jgi:serine/threonine protein kinase
MICQYCGYERAATQPSCPVCGSTQLSLPSEGTPVITPSGQEAHWTPPIPARVTLSPAQRPLTIQHEASTLAPGMTLQGQRYLLVERQEMQQWSQGVYEARWRAQDRESGKEVSIGEVALPLSGNDLQTFFRTATKALLRSNDLLNVFLEQGHGFFVFAAPTGESLHARIQRRGTLNEQDAIECYRQLAEALQFLSQHDPSLAHGLIQPNHIMHVGSRWTLTYGSPLIAGGITQWVPALKETRLATQSSPASDLSSLSATIYYAVTGRVPPVDERERQGDLMNAALSPTFAEILLKGIHPRAEVRYQQPSELVMALGRLTENRREGSRRQYRGGAREQVPQEPPSAAVSAQARPVPVSPPPSPMVAPMRQYPPQGETLLAPFEGLPPLPRSKETLLALLWAGGILLCTVSIVLVARSL